MEQFHKLLILYSKNININSLYNKGQNYNFINKCILQSRFWIRSIKKQCNLIIDRYLVK